MNTDRSPKDYAIEFGRYLADAAERFMAEQNRAAEDGTAPSAESWRALESAIHEFRKRAFRVELDLFDVLAVNIKTGATRVLAAGKTEANADAIVKMAVIRRGVEEEFFKTVPHGDTSGSEPAA